MAHPPRTLVRLQLTGATHKIEGEPGNHGEVLEQVRLVHSEEALELSGAIDGEQLQALRLRASRMDVTFLRRLLALPDALAGRATLEAQLDGTFEAPILQSELRLQGDSPPQLPFDQLQATLAYAQRQLQGDMRIQQNNRDVLALQLSLPIDLRLTALPWPQRFKVLA